jgi:hypothetical protein
MVWRNTIRSYFAGCPCSATGVIRRHPDIKWLRRDRDISELAQLQAEILMPSGRILNLAERWSMQPVPYCRKRTASKLPPSSTYPDAALIRERLTRVSRICRVRKRVMASFTLS